jgi:hypothetical protein
MIVNSASRRSVLAALGAAALPACGRRSVRNTSAPAPDPHVSITPVTGYGQSLFDEIRRIVIEHRVVVRGKSILLKPNLVEFSQDAPINTHPRVVHAALEAFRSLGAAEVRIGEVARHGGRRGLCG